MNLLHMKYAVTIADTNSINKAAEKLYVGQSALSRAIKELEAGLGVTLFERSAKGMTLTADGEVFVRYARTVLKQVDEIENMFNEGAAGKKRFSVCVPRASYIADAFVRFSKLIGEKGEYELFYKETNSMRAVKNILAEDYKLGIVRYAENYDKYYKEMMEEKGLSYKLVTEFSYVLCMSRDCPLAAAENVTYDDLREYTEIAHADPYVPSLPYAEVKKEELPDNSRSRIFVFERASQFHFFSYRYTETFMWVSPVPQELLDRYGLIQRSCEQNGRVYKDVMIHRRDYTLSELDELFVSELVKAKRRVIAAE